MGAVSRQLGRGEWDISWLQEVEQKGPADDHELAGLLRALFVPRSDFLRMVRRIRRGENPSSVAEEWLDKHRTY